MYDPIPPNADVTSPPAPHQTNSRARDQSLTRRGALRAFGACVIAALVLPWRLAQAKKVGIKLSTVKELQHVRGSVVVQIKGRDMLLVRDTQNSIKAIDPMCTHKKCQVRYVPEGNDLACKCHKSQFTLSGKVLGGPAPKPLTTYAADLVGEQIVITLPI